MTVTIPANWTGTLEGTNQSHPFNHLAWKVIDYEEKLQGECGEVVQAMVDELKDIERTEFFRQHIKRTTRKVKIAKGEPVVTDDTSLQTAFHSAMINMQLDTDQMSYDRFKLIYDEVVKQLKPFNEDAIL